MITILVVDHDASARALLVNYLSKHSFQIGTAESQKQVDQLLDTQPADLAVVDVDREHDGFQIVRDLCDARHMPVIITSGDQISESDKVAGLELGASDYITKPFGFREVLARIRVALRDRPDRRAREQNKIYTFDGWRANTRLRRLRHAVLDEVKLTAGEFNLLVAFLQSPGEVLSREQLLLATRMHDQEVFDRTIDVLVLRLRRKLERNPAAPNYIKTERGAGYVFNADVIDETNGRR
ncbi:two-component system OmpR family response regulator [Agrobacterium larrymoorei]|uniref:Regulatory protein VirG n=1 Tax=Agrobacterium larrymoorei TaxID=160699 RepID=A0AAJ2BDA8_9HYPH|nr:winged helix-turn-helix domain-containing protein [Agrobacterium larrymoorei]MDR6101733.1 two-component system OmpR family response regulator [Agrobacterium larrymoorei]